MFDIILCMTLNGGIGYNGKIPWSCKEELQLFKKKTMGNTLLVGIKTFNFLPNLSGRNLVILSKNKGMDLDTALSLNYTGKLFVIGGGQIYNTVLSPMYFDRINRIHLSIMKQNYLTDTSINLDFSKFTIESTIEYVDFHHYVLIPKSTQEVNYLKLLTDVMENGIDRKGRNGMTRSLFGYNMCFDLRNEFPLLTTKKMFFRGIVEELLFFIRGDTNTKILEEKGINIWKGNTSREFLDSIDKTSRKEGMMGPMYGAQWRHYNGNYNEDTGKMSGGIDQLSVIIDLIKNDPTSRRLVMTCYNPTQVHEGVLFPCHSIIIQFYIEDTYLDMYCYNRSQDIFHGIPFNIASSSLLLMIIANVCNLTARYIKIGMGDVHIYHEHFEAILSQTLRIPYALPKVKIPILKSLEDIENLKYNDFKLENYFSHPSIKVDMII